ncbi:MAG: iron ABC transporter permease [Veillonella sp.]|uniref:FecCD family ABC transporter permease n=1 Tax=Veillonella sp. TaxID=1926307 RepID=UPI0025FC12FB|nr:iron ABC transporter permease [Veillonella sp.]MBE6080208.1 iron ABC transporter permease [Veillonella sp.]
MNWYKRPWLLGSLLFVGLILLAGYSLTVGARHIPLPIIWKALVAYDPSQVDELLVRTLRVPRLLLALACGLSFGVAGALMQGITNNPMASPSIMGVNSGAALGLAVAMILLPDSSLNITILFAFAGAALATVIIMALANRNGSRMSPVFLALAGTAVSAVLLAITQALVVYFDVAQDLSYWTAGGISGVRMPQVLLLWPWTLLGLIMAVALSKSVTLLSFGEEMAIGLGGHMGRIRFLAGLAVLILCGSAVAIAGPIGFVGLVTPHMARQLVGIDYRKVIPITALLGAILLVAADLVARGAASPFEIPLGAITALIGVSFFLYLANRKGAR